MHYYKSSGEKVVLEINSIECAGNEGSVHKVINASGQSSLCGKIYHDKTKAAAKQRKIEYMVRNQPLAWSTNQHGTYIYCWPTDALYDENNVFVGFLMPLAYMPCGKLYELTSLKLPSKSVLEASKFDRSNTSSVAVRIKICINLSIAIHALHSQGKYVIVDFKPQNVLISSTGRVSIIDVDSFQVIDQSMLYNADVATPEYAPPESDDLVPSTSKISLSWDRFSLAVCIYEIFVGIT